MVPTVPMMAEPAEHELNPLIVCPGCKHEQPRPELATQYQPCTACREWTWRRDCDPGEPLQIQTGYWQGGPQTDRACECGEPFTSHGKHFRVCPCCGFQPTDQLGIQTMKQEELVKDWTENNRWEFYMSKDGHRWRLTDAKNGKGLGGATQGYSNRADCVDNARRHGWTDKQTTKGLD